MARDHIARKKIKDLTTRVEALEAPTPPPEEPPVEPPSKWRTIFAPTRLDEYSGTEAGYPGSYLEQTSTGGFYANAPNPAEGHQHVEVHEWRSGGCPLPGERAYQWDLLIPRGITLPHGDYFTVAQFHGNNKPGYTGGVGIDPQTNEIQVRVSGGNRISGNRYEYEERYGIGIWVPGVRQTIRVEALWTPQHAGYSRARLDGGDWSGVNNVPTASVIADNEMFYLGIYADYVPTGGLRVGYENIKVEAPA